MTNTRNTPIEAIEHTYPFRITEYRIRDNSGGNGQHRGGNGVVRCYGFDAPCEVTLITERRRYAPYGLSGGEPGRPGLNRLHRADGQSQTLPGKCTIECQPGDVLEIATPGGGGWGQPSEQA